MADAAVVFLLDNLTQLIRSQVELLEQAPKNLLWIQTEYWIIVAFLQSFDLLHELPPYQTVLVSTTLEVIRKTKDIMETYRKRQNQLSETSFYLSPLGSLKLQNLRRQLGSIRDRFIDVREKWKLFHQYHRASNNPTLSEILHEQSTSAEMCRLELAAVEQHLDPDVLECILWVRDELAPLNDFLQKFDNVQVLRERQKIWIQELRGIFRFIGHSLTHHDLADASSRDVVRDMQGKILQLYRRYYAYGFGEILVDNTSRSIFPRIGMTTTTTTSIPVVSRNTGPVPFLVIEQILLPSNPRRRRTVTWLPPAGASIEMLRIDLRLMKALLEDSRSMADLDERAKVWLDQLQEISVELEATLDAEHDDQSKIDHISSEIRDLIARKITYGIGIALGEAPFPESIAATFVDNKRRMGLLSGVRKLEKMRQKETVSRRWAESVRKELQLVKASLEDINRMENLDEGLKVRVEELLRIGGEAKSYYTRVQLKEIKQVCDDVFKMENSNDTYGTGDNGKLTHSFFIYALVGLVEFRGRISEREIMLMQSFYDNIDTDDLNGATKAWVLELGKLCADASKLINSEPIQRCTDMMEGSSPFEEIQERVHQLSELRTAYDVDLREILFPGVHEIKEKLLADQGDSFIIPVLEMRPKHKKALLELIQTDNAITNQFDFHAWVSVPGWLNGISILECMVTKIIQKQLKMEDPTEELLMETLQETLMHNRYLVVLDEIQSVDVWHRLQTLFTKTSTGSRIILISNEHTWSFLSSSFKAIFDPVRLGKLPLETREVRPGSDAVGINSVPSFLRQYLYYFLLFPAKFEVPTRRLIVLWVAEGLVHRNGRESDEDVANIYLNKLIELEMVVGKTKKLNGRYKACQLNEHMRDTLLVEAEGSQFFQHRQEKLYRIVDHNGTNDSCFIHIHGNPKVFTSVKSYGDVMSFMSFETREGNKPGQDIGNFIQKCISTGCFLELKVLDLEKVFRPKLTEAICRLLFLKYVGLRWTYLEHLPEHMNKLLNLQVLDVKHTYISELPTSIWRMQYLRHLYLSETYGTKFVGRPSNVSLNELQTLWGAFIDENTHVKKGLDTSRNIRKLGLSCRSRSSQLSAAMEEQLEAVNNWITTLEHLEVLRIKSQDENARASKLHLKPLKNEKLNTVYLLGKLEPAVVSEFPVNLIDVTLSGSELNDDPMTYLGNLPKLRILRLLSQSVVCSSMRCSKGSFPQLVILKIWKLEKLEDWEVEEDTFLSLEDLEIRSCMNLKTLPDGLQHVQTLREFTLSNMSESFIDETMAKHPQLWNKIKVE